MVYYGLIQYNHETLGANLNEDTIANYSDRYIHDRTFKYTIPERNP